MSTHQVDQRKKMDTIQLICAGIVILGLGIALIDAIVKNERLEKALKAKEEERRVVAIALGSVLRLISTDWRLVGIRVRLENPQISIDPRELFFYQRKNDGKIAGHGLPLDEATGKYLIKRVLQDDGAFQPPSGL